MAVNSSIGGTLSVVASTPATEDESGYEALSFIEVENVISVGEFGDNSEDITFNLLKSGRTSHVNGVRDLGEIAVSCAYDDQNNTGIELVNTNANTDTVMSWKLVDTNGATSYWQGRAANYRQTERTASSFEGRNFVIRGTSGVTEVAAP